MKVYRWYVFLIVVLIVGTVYSAKRERPPDCEPVSSVPPVCLDGEVVVNVPGDMNGDCKLDVADLLMLQRQVMGEVCPTPRGDVNNDMDVNVGDLILLQRAVLGID